MQELGFSPYTFDIRAEREIFDIVRRKYVALTPEEWVRQHVIHFLVQDKGYPASLLAVEHSLIYNTMQKRCDIVAFNTQMKPTLLVECKAPGVKVSEQTFRQIAMYNVSLKVPFLLVSNGLKNYCCQVDHATAAISFLQDVPAYQL